jgi:hypothetical protein
LSETFKGLNYRQVIYDTGVIAKHFTGWSYREIMSMTPRERRHWIEWASAIIDLEKSQESNG